MLLMNIYKTTILILLFVSGLMFGNIYSKIQLKQLQQRTKKMYVSNENDAIAQNVFQSLPKKFEYNVSTKNSQRHKFTLQPVKLFKNQDAKHTMLILIKSSPVNYGRRNIIRSTWGSLVQIDGFSVRSLFLVGSIPHNEELMFKILQENKMYGDILQSDIFDIYSNLPYKVLSSMQWLIEHKKQINSRYIAYTDDDCVINMSNLAECFEEKNDTNPTKNNNLSIKLSGNPKLNKRNNEDNNIFIIVEHNDINIKEPTLYCGFAFSRNSPANRNPKSKWYVSNDIYDKNFYPPFCHGGMYIIPWEMMEKIYQISLVTDYSGFHLEDVLITGILRHKMNSKTQNIAPIDVHNGRPMMFHVAHNNRAGVEWFMQRKWKIWRNEFLKNKVVKRKRFFF